MKYLNFLILLFTVNPLLSQTPFLKKIKVDKTEIVLFSDGSWQYYKPVNTSTLFSTYTPGGSQIACKDIFCRTAEPASEIVRIPCFKPEEIFRDSGFFRFSPEYYKEVAQDDFLQVRMKYAQKQVRLMLAGEEMAIIPLDSSKRKYLLKIFHRNGLESWYYPLAKVMPDADITKPGSLIGLTYNNFFWQIRVNNHSIGAGGLFNKDFTCINDDLLIDSKNLLDPNFAVRKKSFLLGMGKQMTDNTPPPDFDKLLEEEMKKKN